MAEGVLLDLDGVLNVAWEPLTGAVETVEWLTERGVEFRPSPTPPQQRQLNPQ
jgi:ribonucleotide monophosphatase NagD (HAD superfamily)